MKSDESASVPNAMTIDHSECSRALQKLDELVLGGLRHGFFECTVSCDIVKGGKRRLVIKAGVSHQFVIPLEELGACA